jgi:ferric-dicitrate binding protein FerR (iron transport regulator)
VQERIRFEPAARPDPAYRERMRRGFRDGSLSGTSPQRRRDLVWRWIAVSSASAMILAAIVLLWRGTEIPPVWRVTDVRGSGELYVDGEAWSGDAHRDRPFSALAERLRDGTALRTGDLELELTWGRELMIRVGPGSDLELPRTTGQRLYEARLLSGSLQVSTGPAFTGSGLEVKSGEVSARLSGTTLSVIADAERVCVLVLDGEVECDERGSRVAVAPGRCRIVYADRSRPTDEHEIGASDRSSLEELRSRARAAFR